MNNEKNYAAWQERCIDECNRIYGTNFSIEMIHDSEEKYDRTFEVCEDGSIHFECWYEGLPKYVS